MRTKAEILVIFVFFYFAVNDLSAQITDDLSTESRRARRAYERAEAAYSLRDNKLAIVELEQALDRDDQFVEARLLLAEIHYQDGSYQQSIPHWQAAIKIDSLFFPAAHYFLATAFFNSGQYSEAQKYFRTATEMDVISDNLLERSREMLLSCEFALHAIENPVDFVPVNPGQAINSEYAEYSPALTADEQTLIFTRKKPLYEDDKTGFVHYFEDFYVSHYRHGEWQEAENLGPPLNTSGNEGAQTITPDGRHLFFTACNRPDGMGSCDIYYSRKAGSRWSVPVNAGRPLNSASWESQPSISADGQSIFFASSRAGSIGTTDIWMATRNASGNWNTPVNLGPEINTNGNELSPFIHSDSKTLYFASDGHPGMGGLDIFYSRRNAEGNWCEPINIGYPVNTHGDEFALIVGASGQWAWFASDTQGGFNDSDLYTFELYPEAQPSPVTYMKGIVFDIDTNEPLSANFELTDVQSNELIIAAEADPDDGSFLIAIPTGRDLALNVSKTGYLFFSEHFSYADHRKSPEPYLRNIPLKQISEGYSTILRNIFFETDSYALKESSYPELENLLALLKNNPGIHIEISGHTDSTGSFDYNMELSENRARSVRNYLTDKGVSEKRLRYKGYADVKPVDTNDTEEGRANNRRTEFEIIRPNE
jgi:outer membrane protein OmpA-like peptidoglycan-associated protein